MVRPPGFEPGITGLEGLGNNDFQRVLAVSGSQVLSWPRTKQGFLEYVRYKKYNDVYTKGMVSYLDRFVQEIRDPADIMRVFADLSVGQQNQLNRGMRAWFNYLGMTGLANEEFLDKLRYLGRGKKPEGAIVKEVVGVTDLLLTGKGRSVAKH
ncbi:MAG: hypothetical protein OEZ29_04860 [Candidatus Bathyarchaeota archaeon]|nr:hypothetical protein [Candidatus Bathyarchaeota archaeon]MDH5779908.1 hypothetical protein [Candidatus Bathyarchaeota archaeon]